MKKAKPTLKNIIAYIQGNLRYKLYYSKFAFLIRPHIKQQIDIRINSMDKQCYEEGQCKMCGCQTTALQMANKACDKPCYPSMMSKIDWNKIKNRLQVYDTNTGKWWHVLPELNIFWGNTYISFEDEIMSQPKPISKLEESTIKLFKDEEAHPMSHTEETIFQKYVREYPAIKLMEAESEVFIEKMKNLNRTTKEYNEKLEKLHS